MDSVRVNDIWVAPVAKRGSYWAEWAGVTLRGFYLVFAAYSVIHLLMTSETPGDWVNSAFRAGGEESGAPSVTWKYTDVLTLGLEGAACLSLYLCRVIWGWHRTVRLQNYGRQKGGQTERKWLKSSRMCNISLLSWSTRKANRNMDLKLSQIKYCPRTVTYSWLKWKLSALRWDCVWVFV